MSEHTIHTVTFTKHGTGNLKGMLLNGQYMWAPDEEHAKDYVAGLKERGMLDVRIRKGRWVPRWDQDSNLTWEEKQ